MAKRRVRVEGVDENIGVQKDHGSRVSSRSFSHVIVGRRGAFRMASIHALLLMRSARSGFSSLMSRKRPSACCWMSKTSPARPPGKTTRFLVSTVDVLMVGLSHLVHLLSRAMKFIKKNTKAKKPWFAWVATSGMHFYTHLKPKGNGVTGLGIFADSMVEHDGHVGQILYLLEKLKITENTLVVYNVDNDPHYNEWPDGGISPFRGEKNTN
jgi:hypothetical protein